MQKLGVVEHARESSTRVVTTSTTSLLLHGLLNGRQTALQLGIAGIVLQTFFVSIVGAKQISLAVKSSTLAPPAFGPVRLELSRLLRILESRVPLLLGSVGSRSVRVEDVVFGLDGDGLGKLVTVAESAHIEHLTLSGVTLEEQTHMASSKFFSAMALLPRALSSSALAMVDEFGEVQVENWRVNLKTEMTLLLVFLSRGPLYAVQFR